MMMVEVTEEANCSNKKQKQAKQRTQSFLKEKTWFEFNQSPRFRDMEMPGLEVMTEIDLTNLSEFLQPTLKTINNQQSTKTTINIHWYGRIC